MDLFTRWGNGAAESLLRRGNPKNDEPGNVGEVGRIEGQDLSDTVRERRGGETHIVGALPAHETVGNQPEPHRERLRRVGQHREERDESIDRSPGRRRVPTQSVHFSRSRRDDPELDDHLRGEARLPTRRDTLIHRGTYDHVLRIVLLEKAKDDVRVEEDPRHR